MTMSPRLRHNLKEISRINPDLAERLANTPTENPPDVSQDPMRWRRCLQQSASTYGAVFIAIGWGNGDLLRHIASNDQLRHKTIVIFILPSELPQVRQSLENLPQLNQLLNKVDWSVEFITGEASIFKAIHKRFPSHQDVAKLGGCDLINQHPLSADAETEREMWSSVVEKTLSDCPPLLGNSIDDSFTGLLNCLKNANSLLKSAIPDDFAGFYGDTPVISIGGGPSLMNHIDELKALQDHCILICGDSTLQGLLDKGIQPHFTTPIERVPVTAELVACAEGSRTAFAGSPVVPQEAVSPFGQRTICSLGFDNVYQWLVPERKLELFTGSSTGVFSVSVGSALSTGPIFLVGHDLCLSEGSSHWQGSQTSAQLWKGLHQEAQTDTRGENGYYERWIQGNNGQLVQSIGWWDRFRGEINHIASGIGQNQRRTIFNVAAHDKQGALIENTQAAPLPNPGAIPALTEFKLPPGKPERVKNFHQRAALLVGDCRALQTHTQNVLSKYQSYIAQNPHTWDLTNLSQEITVTSGVSEGNQFAFTYFLRSALSNSLLESHRKLRHTSSNARRNRIILDCFLGVAEAISNATESLAPRLQDALDEI